MVKQKMTKVNYDISGMHCASCSTLINRALGKVKGITYANVNLSTNRATVEYDENLVNNELIISTIKKKGYGAVVAGKTTDYAAIARKKHKEIKIMKYDLIFSSIFAIPVLKLIKPKFFGCSIFVAFFSTKSKIIDDALSSSSRLLNSFS